MKLYGNPLGTRGLSSHFPYRCEVGQEEVHYGAAFQGISSDGGGGVGVGDRCILPALRRGTAGSDSDWIPFAQWDQGDRGRSGWCTTL